MSQTMNGHSLEKNQWQRLKPVSSAARQRCTDPGKELSSGLSDQKKNLIDLTEARMDTDMKYRHCSRDCLTSLSVASRQCWKFIFNLLPALHIHTPYIYMQHSCIGSPGACRPVILVRPLCTHHGCVCGTVLERCYLPHKSHEPPSNRLEKCPGKSIRSGCAETKEGKTMGRMILKWAKWWKSPLLCWDCSGKLCTICYFPL